MATRTRVNDAPKRGNTHTYVARRDVILTAAIARGIKPSARGIGLATGIGAQTMSAMLNGRPPSNASMAVLVEHLGRPFEDLFELALTEAS